MFNLNPELKKILNEIINSVELEQLSGYEDMISIFILPTTLFAIGAVGVVFNKKNLIFLLISLELMLLAITLNFVFFSIFFNSGLGQIYSLLILTVAAAESAIGLGILVVVFRLKHSIRFEELNYLRG